MCFILIFENILQTSYLGKEGSILRDIAKVVFGLFMQVWFLGDKDLSTCNQDANANDDMAWQLCNKQQQTLKKKGG